MTASTWVPRRQYRRVPFRILPRETQITVGFWTKSEQEGSNREYLEPFVAEARSREKKEAKSIPQGQESGLSSSLREAGNLPPCFVPEIEQGEPLRFLPTRIPRCPWPHTHRAARQDDVRGCYEVKLALPRLKNALIAKRMRRRRCSTG